MKIYKGKYGYSTTAYRKDDSGEHKVYINVQVPKDWSEQDVIDGDLQFVTSKGTFPAFFSNYQSKDGLKEKLVIFEQSARQKEHAKVEQENKDLRWEELTAGAEHIEITEDQLPFY